MNSANLKLCISSISVAITGSKKKNLGLFPTQDLHLIISLLLRILIAKGNDTNGSRSCDLGQGDLLKFIGLPL